MGALTVLIAASNVLAGSGGALDRSFGGDGVARLRLAHSGEFAAATDLAVDSRGRVVVAGFTQRGSYGKLHLALARYRPNGRLDRSFGRRGVVRAQTGSVYGRGVAIQPQGRIVVLGVTCGLIAVRPNGEVARRFGRRGKARVDLGRSKSCTSLAVGRDGAIVIAGSNENRHGRDRFALARLTPNGAPDRAFSSNGKLTAAFPGASAQAESVAVLRDGSIAAAGNVLRRCCGLSNRVAAARFRPHGRLDPGFSDDGREQITVTEEGIDAHVEAVMATPRRTTLAGGEGSWLLRLRADGAHDRSFGDGGTVITKGFGLNDAARERPGPDSKGRIVAVGGALRRGQADTALARYLPDGSLDERFGRDGIRTVNLARKRNGTDAAEAVALYPRGRIVTMGQLFGRAATVARFHR